MLDIEEVWSRIATPEKQAQIAKGVVRLAISMGLSPESAGAVFSGLDNQEANNIAYFLSGVADGPTVKAVGEKLRSVS